jgi:UDP-N-acetylmuramyl pentapeptide phosphotransferase/UDP-N-acetylglucosamine-1-phosphate transferase
MIRVGLYVFVVLFGVLACRWAAGFVSRLRLIDRPNARSSHTRPTPRGAGLGLLLALVAGCAAWLVVEGGAGPREWGPLLGAVSLLAVTGFADDREGLGVAPKFLAQVVAGLLVAGAVGVVRSVDLPVIGTLHLGLLGLPLTLFFVVGFANAFNFMDGSDGIAGLFAATSAAGLALLGVIGGGGAACWLALPLSAASLSFLSVNWSPARAFMGDAGSLPLGLLLAGLAVALSRHVPFVSCFLVLGPFLFDTLYTVLRRAVRGENILRAHRSHLYQRLLATGMTHPVVALLYGGWTLLSAAGGLLYLQGLAAVRIAALGAAILAGVAVICLTKRREGTRVGNGRLA